MNAQHPEVPSDACGVTILRAVRDYRATKQWRWSADRREWTKVSYEAGAMFHPREHRVGNLAELVSVLDTARKDPRAFAVRGALTPEVREELATNPQLTIRRRKLKKADVMPSLAEVPRRWVMIDIDNWPLPSWADLVDDPETAIDHAVHELLPESFRDAQCWWQLSSSAGFSAGFLKVHLFFWLTEPAMNEHIRKVLKQHAPGVDRAPFNAAQPHFIADPIIEGGHDPLPRRTGWRKGLETAVVLPTLSPEAFRPSAPSGTRAHPVDVLGVLALLGDGEGLEGFHDPLRRATLLYARRANRYDERDDAAIKRQLLDAIAAAPKRADRGEMSSYDDAYLQRLIDGAFALTASDEDVRTMQPHHKPPVHTREQAQEAVAKHIGGFVARALAWNRLDDAARAAMPAEQAGIIVGVGVGKSSAARKELGAFVAAAKADGLPHRVLWLVPTHQLGAEALEAMEGLGLNVAVMRGRDAEIPGTGDPEDDIPPQKMCMNLDAVADALIVGDDIERAVCGSGKSGEPSCPWREECAYQAQKKQVAAADVVIAAHQSLFHQLAKEVSRGLGMAIVDESWWQAGILAGREIRLAGFSETPLTYPVLAKGSRPKAGTPRGWRPKQDDEATNDLHVISARAEAAFATIPEGELMSRDVALAAGLSIDDCALAAKLEWRRKVEGAIWPGQTKKQRQEGVDKAQGNTAIPRRVAIWRALEELLRGDASHTGRLQMGRSKKEGDAERVILLHTRREVGDAVDKLPLLCLDATMPEAIVRHFLPRLDVLADVQAQAPHMRVQQVLGGWGKTSLVQSEKTTPEENRRRSGLVAELVDFVRLNGGGNGLVITYEAIEQQFAQPSIRTGHFNAIAGLDKFKDVRSLFVIGRPFPDARELRIGTMAVTGRAIAAESGQVETRGALMADGTGTAIGVRVYADPDLEALRVAITDAEVIQAIGRGRGVWRDAEAPLDVFVFADVVLPIPVTRIARWADIRLDPIARMIARGIALTSPADAATVFPDLFPSQEAAKKALQRAGAEGYFGDKSLGIYIPRGMSPKSGLVGVSYRPEGRGQQQRRAYVRPDLVAGVRAWLTERLGPLAQCDEPSLPDPIISPAVAKAAHPAPKPPSAQEPPMPANDAPLPAARIEPLRPDEVYPPLKPHSPIMPIEGVWRVTTGKGPPRVIITSPEPPVTIHGRATTPFPPFCRGHFAPLTVPQEARQ